MKKHFTFSAISLIALAGVFTSCSKDDDQDELGNGTLGNEGSGTMEVFNPTESKTFLSNTGSEFLNLFNSSDQSELITLIDYFCDKYGHLNPPAEFEIEEESYSRAGDATPTELMKSLRRLAAGCDASSISRGFYTYTYDIYFDRFKGIYEPNLNKNKWVRVDDSDDVIFRFTGPSGQTCEAKATASGKASNFEISYEEDYDYYDNDRYRFLLSVPNTMTFTLTKGRIQLANGKVVTSINYDAHNYEASIDCTAANLQVKVITNGNDSKLYETSTVAINGKVIVGTVAELNGKNLCNVDKIIDEFEDDIDDEILTKWFTTAQAKVSVLDKVQAYADVTFNNQFFDIDDYWDYWNFSSKSEAQKEAQRVADVFNNNISAKIRYNNTATDQALIKFEPRLDEWSYGWEFTVEPVLYFPQDQSSYYFDEYFENGFRSLTNQWENLVKSYERLWK